VLKKTTEHLSKFMERYLFWQADDCPVYHKFALFYGTWMLITFVSRARRGLYPEQHEL